jgi:hypothetical protein
VVEFHFHPRVRERVPLRCERARFLSPNHGFCIHDIGNYTFHFREAGADHEPVLFIAYKPAVPEGTLIMVR